MRNQLLCTFTKKYKLNDTIDEIKEKYDLSFNKIFVLKNEDNSKEFILTYNANSSESVEPLRNTISIHRKKETRTLYTINALNHVVSLMNDGKMDSDYTIDWNNFRNMLLTTDDNGLKKIKTNIYKIVNL